MLKITKTVDTIHEDYEGVILEIARWNRPDFQAKFRRLSKPYKRQIDSDSLPDAKGVEILAGAMAGTILVGWAQFVSDGEEIPYSEEQAKELLINDPDVRDFVKSCSENLSLFLTSTREELKKT